MQARRWWFAIAMRKARAVVAEIGPDRAMGGFVDVTDAHSIDRLIADAETTFGVPEIWVNNAGIDIIEPFASISPDNWRRILEVDLTAAFLVGQRGARTMVDAKKAGSIINI